MEKLTEFMLCCFNVCMCWKRILPVHFILDVNVSFIHKVLSLFMVYLN
jgi:hypothetical protein